MNAMASSRVTILVNGSGDGFINPTRGLRQGCPLSPYLFILAMEFLTKKIQVSLNQGKIEGVRVARTTPVLTSIMYVDDLIIMGKAEPDEVTEYQRILSEFAQQSGLMVNPEKSSIWFSWRCEEQCKHDIVAQLGVKEAGDREKYLGFLISQNQPRHDLTSDLILDKIRSRITGWKMHLLSHAGCLTLIKSVLTSVPVYYMSTTLLPTRIINRVNALTRNFFWGKVEGQKYMCLIAWNKMCRPTKEGGLGIRDMRCFNETLLLKIVWQFASQADKLWVQVMRSKYYPRGGMWGVKNKNGTSKL